MSAGLTKHIILIGMPGAGKSYLAREWSKQLAMPCIDLDRMIEEEEGLEIPAIFRQLGEAAFRKMERKALLAALNRPSSIIASGGGTPCFNNNIEIMKEAGIVVYLKAPVALLVERLQAPEHSRPLLQHARLQEQLEQLLYIRRPIYEQAHITLDATGLTAADVLRVMVKRDEF